MSIVILGSTGCVGRSLTKLLCERKIPYLAPRHNWLCNGVDAGWSEEDTIINLVGVKTNLFLNKTKPATICSNTLRMNINVLDICKEYNVKKLVNIVSSCAFPGNLIEPMKESEFWNGIVHESVRPHGLAKKTVYALSQFYRQEFGLNSICLCFNSIFGGYPSWKKPDTLKVLESLVKKFVDGRNYNSPSITLYGNGEAYREFLHADDAAEAILLAAHTYDSEELVNISNQTEIQIKKLAEGIKLATSYTGEILWQGGEDGQSHKLLSMEKCMRELKFFPKIPLVEGIQQTISSYEQFLLKSKRFSR